MKHLKMLGLAVVATVALTAFAGAGAASATTLFTDSAHKTDYPTGTTVHFTLAAGTSWSYKNGSTVIATCTEAVISGLTQQTSATWIEVPAGSFTKRSCNQTVHTLAKGKLELMATSGTSAEVRGVETQITYQVFGTSCTYGFGEGVKLGTLTSGAPAVLKINATIPRVAGGMLCPSSTDWQADFTVTSPHALYITN